MKKEMREAANVISQSQVVIGFTGAGVSVESGIPDFRNAEGFWEGFNLETFEKEIDNREMFEKYPAKVWRFFQQAISLMEQAKPNDCHNAMGRLGELGRLAAIITQNVDGLHQAAGSIYVIELHGNIKKLHCPKCKTRYDWQEVRNTKIPPLCACGSALKPDVPLFGEEINLESFSTSHMLAMNANVFLIVGAHGAVAPVNRIPLIAKEHGAFIIEVNKEKSLYTNRITDIFLQGRAAEVMPKLVHLVEDSNVGDH